MKFFAQVALLSACITSVVELGASAGSHSSSLSRRTCKYKGAGKARLPSTIDASAGKPKSTSTSSSTTAVSTSAQPKATDTGVKTTAPSSGCFPSVGFKMPGSVPSSLDNWWCDTSSEYAFVGFSYAVDACQSLDTLKREFKDIRNTFNGRYVRLYGACDKKGFYDNVVDAAWDAGIGVHALIWFGFDGGNIYKTRRDSLFNTLKSNPKAKFVTRVVQYGSEPLFDHVLPAKELAKEVESAKATLSNLRIPVTVSELSFGYTQPGQDKAGAMAVLKAIDFVDAHILPLFAGGASTAKNAWGNVMGDIKWFSENSGGKKIYLSENGWPSVKGQGNINPQSRTAVANVENEKDYFDMLDSKCSDLKAVKGGGVGWFAHLYSDSQGMGYGIYGTNGKLKFPFKPRTSC